MIIYVKKLCFLSLAASFLVLSACSGKPIAYMQYSENGIGDVSYKLDYDVNNPNFNLMSDDLTVIDRTKILGLKNNPNFNASAVFVSNESKKETVFAKNCYKKLYPASLTKLMTAYVAFKYSEDLDKEVIVPVEARRFSDPYAKVMGLMENDHISMNTLLHCLLIHSSNDAAKTIAISVAGSEEEFVKRMNEEAMNLGAVATNFTNSHGLHDSSNYTTLYDLYLIFHELIKDDRFLSIISQENYIAQYKNGLGGKIVKRLNSTNQYFTKLQPSPKEYKILGGKTGTTNEAGSCMIIYTKATSGDYYVIGLLKATDTLNLYAGFSSIFENIP